MSADRHLNMILTQVATTFANILPNSAQILHVFDVSYSVWIIVVIKISNQIFLPLLPILLLLLLFLLLLILLLIIFLAIQGLYAISAFRNSEIV